MFSVANTTRLTGVSISGDRNDFHTLKCAIYRYVDFYISGILHDIESDLQEATSGEQSDNDTAWSDNEKAYFLNMKANFKALCDHLNSCSDGKLEDTEAAPHKIATGSKPYGNVYTAVHTVLDYSHYNTIHVLYPWALYYLFVLRSMLDQLYKNEWVQAYNAATDTTSSSYNSSIATPYGELEIAKDRAVIEVFISCLWEAFRSVYAGDTVAFATLYDYFNHRKNSDIPENAYIDGICTFYLNLDQASAFRNEPSNKKQLLKLHKIRKYALTAIAYEMLDATNLDPACTVQEDNDVELLHRSHRQYKNCQTQLYRLTGHEFITLAVFNEKAIRILLRKIAICGNSVDINDFKNSDSTHYIKRQ